MRNLAVRLTLLGLFAVAIGVAAYFYWRGESHARLESHAARMFDAAALSAERDVFELRAAQQAYVAAGQGTDFWASKVAATSSVLRDALSALRAQATSLSAQSAIDNASSALQGFEQIDRRAREYARSGQKLLASDIIFTDGIGITGAAAGSLDQARAAELQAREAAIVGIRRQQVLAAAATAAIALLITALLAPRRDAPRAPEAGAPAARMIPDTDPSADRGLDLGPALDESWTARQRARDRPPAIDLAGVASLCTDLARIVDTRALPAILGRTADVLDAPGIVLWIADPDGRELNPIVTHGYSQQLVSRLGTILRDAENATASAFRTSVLQTVRADAISNGAIAAPLVTPVGCVGVMAAEVRHEGETDSAKLAAATIVAAQLATLVGPPSSRAQARTEATGA